MAGYGFARFRFKGNAVFVVMVILTIIVPPQMLGMPNYLLMKNFDFLASYGLLSGSPSTLSLVNSPLSFFLPAALGQGLRAGVFILVFARCLPAFPTELEEAAFIDGCGYCQDLFPHHAAQRADFYRSVFFVFPGVVLGRLLSRQRQSLQHPYVGHYVEHIQGAVGEHPAQGAADRLLYGAFATGRLRIQYIAAYFAVYRRAPLFCPGNRPQRHCRLNEEGKPWRLSAKY
ncbi:MAG: hypothetical protein ACLU9S_01925 [Oscillospiraceae bacterium]